MNIIYDIYCSFYTKLISPFIKDFEDSLHLMLGSEAPYFYTEDVKIFSITSSLIPKFSAA